MTTPVAAFDFDGTLTHRDTLGPFLASIVGTRRLRRVVAAEAGRAVRSAKRPDRDTIKLGLLRRLFAGVPEADYAAAGTTYAATLSAGFRSETISRLRRHQSDGHRIVIVSAGLGTYLRPLGTELGLDHVIAVELEVGAEGRLTGSAIGPNVRGPEKAVRLRRWLDERVDGAVELWAYGDSAGDIDLLAMADHPTWIGRRGERVRRRVGTRSVVS